MPLTRALQGLNATGVVWVFALTFIICADIVARTVFDSPIAGVTEIVALSLVASVFLMVAFAAHSGRLMRVELLVAPLAARRPALEQTWQAVLAAIGAALFVLIAVGMWPDFVRSLRTAEFAGVEGIYKIPVWPIKLLVIVGSVAAALELARQVAARWRAAQAAPPDSARWLAAVGVVVVAAVVAVLVAADAGPRTVGVAMIALTLALIVAGMPIAITLLCVGFLGLSVLRGSVSVATRTLALASEGTISDFVFAAVPLFVLMGLFVNVSDVGRDAFRAAQRVFGGLRGGLGVATVAANAVFAAITGISIAAAAIFTKIAVPEMVRQGYTKRFAVGLTAGSSLLGMLIPPSLLLIIYGVLAEVSIGALFRAAVIPGILLAAAFAAGVVLMAFLAPGFVGDVRRETRAIETDAEDARPAGGPGSAGAMAVAARAPADSTWVGMLAVVVLIVLVLGGIYGGVFTPTEAGAAGAAGAMAIALLRRKLDWKRLWDVICETGQVSVSILFLIIAASTFSRMLTLTELPQDLAGFLADAGLGLYGFLLVYLLILVVLGMLLDSTSIMLIVLPLALPIASALGADLIWFGVVTTIAIEIGLLTPPFGLSVYVIKAAIDDPKMSLGAIFAGAAPFVLITLIVTLALIFFPQLSLVLV